MTRRLRDDEGDADECVSIRKLKELVLEKFPDDHPVRAAILAERDALTIEAFLAKMEVWVALLNWRS